MLYVGIDNGVSGSIAILTSSGEVLAYAPTPVKKDLNYTKKKAYVNRVDVGQLRHLFEEWFQCHPVDEIRVFLERPMINPGRWMASCSAMRCLEATLIALESKGIGLTGYMDSKPWQKEMLPAGLRGDELKEASRQVGSRKWPHLAKQIAKQKDADALLIAEYARRKQL